MDKSTLSNYGWVVCVILVLAIMISLATPFGSVIRSGVEKTVSGFKSDAEGVLDNMGGASSFDDLGGGGSGGAGGMGGGEPQPPSVEELQEQYTFNYYSTLAAAVTDVNNSAIGDTADANKENAVAGVYTDNDHPYVVLLKDTTEATRIKPSTDMTINLGGRTLTSSDGVAIDVYSGNVKIDGRLAGSEIREGSAVQVRTGNVIIDGGTYIDNTNGKTQSACINSAGNLTVSNATIVATETTGKIYGIFAQTNSTATISNCTITATSTSGKAIGVLINDSSTVIASNCDIRAYANYGYENGAYTSSSQGVANSGTLTLNDCYVMGVHSGISSHGPVYINGGTYEGYGHGGFYFSGANSTSYVRNAIIRECAMPEGFADNGGECNKSGFYIGGSSDADNITVYMDNCNISARAQTIVLRGARGEQNNTLYISNSTIDTKSIRIDNDTHKLFIGTGCNFTADDTSLPEVVTQTDEVYVQE